MRLVGGRHTQNSVSPQWLPEDFWCLLQESLFSNTTSAQGLFMGGSSIIITDIIFRTLLKEFY